MQMIPAADGATRDPDLIGSNCLPYLMMANHLIVDDHGQTGADVGTRVCLQLFGVLKAYFCAFVLLKGEVEVRHVSKTKERLGNQPDLFRGRVFPAVDRNA